MGADTTYCGNARQRGGTAVGSGNRGATYTGSGNRGGIGSSGGGG